MTVISSKKVKTRKAHRCLGCLRSFPAGTTMMKWDTEDGGSISTAYHCATCEEIDAFTDHYDDWLFEGWVLEDIAQIVERGQAMTPEEYMSQRKQEMKGESDER